MNQFVEYQDWPTLHKVATALSTKPSMIKSYKLIRNLAYFVLAIGAITLIDTLSGSPIENKSIIDSIGFFIMGAMNIQNAQVFKWINENSSWEERAKHTSSTMHKIIFLASYTIMVVFLYYIVFI